MIYTELDKIPLSRFIDVYLGNINRVADGGKHSKEEKKAAAEKLCSDYLSIVGGRSMLSQISRRNEVLKLQMRLACIGACRRLISAGDWEGACKVFATLGYRLRPDDRIGIKAKADSIEASDKYRLDKLVSEFRQADKRPAMDRTYFTKERVAVMSHVKMYIDSDTFSAAEYAYMVKRMCDELDAAIRASREKR